MHIERYSVKKLGAKEARDQAAANAPKEKGAKKRVNDKKQMGSKAKGKPVKPGKPGKPQNAKKTADDDDESSQKKKKGEFRGVKVNAMKQKNKKKKVPSQMHAMAKKIAPKSA